MAGDCKKEGKYLFGMGRQRSESPLTPEGEYLLNIIFPPQGF